ncbi:hypothetical protein [Dechloromonas sp. HYN0024]|nr:hypothetical protein [Dechloromonas sp. HYN0024]
MPDWILHIGGYLALGGMAYGAIRADLKNLHEMTVRAHERIDAHIDTHH